MKKGLLVQIILVIFIVSSYFLIDFNEIYNSFKPDIKLVKQENCNLHKNPCSIKIQDGRVFTLEIFPKDIPLMKTLRFRVTSADKTIKDLNLRLYSKNMFMGYFNLKLNKIKDGIFEVSSLLPTCPVGKMIWNADLEIDSIGAKFIFKTE
ncbi:MAG: hypothetical protein HRT40_13370 [Campylobacteraceae bacterium]|nr:hypothetical protein [Campylobacteraceae bacterium]